MGVIQIQLPEPLQQLADRQVAKGRVASVGDFLLEAARRFADDIAHEDGHVTPDQAGTAEATWDDFLDAPGVALNERVQPAPQQRDGF